LLSAIALQFETFAREQGIKGLQQAESISASPTIVSENLNIELALIIFLPQQSMLCYLA
jgi:hypothetical protein